MNPNGLAILLFGGLFVFLVVYGVAFYFIGRSAERKRIKKWVALEKAMDMDRRLRNAVRRAEGSKIRDEPRGTTTSMSGVHVDLGLTNDPESWDLVERALAREV